MPRPEALPLVDDKADAYGETFREAVALKLAHGNRDGWWKDHPWGYCVVCQRTYGERRKRERRSGSRRRMGGA